MHGVMDGEFVLRKGGLDHLRPFTEEQQSFPKGLDEGPWPFEVEEVTLV